VRYPTSAPAGRTGPRAHPRPATGFSPGVKPDNPWTPRPSACDSPPQAYLPSRDGPPPCGNSSSKRRRQSSPECSATTPSTPKPSPPKPEEPGKPTLQATTHGDTPQTPNGAHPKPRPRNTDHSINGACQYRPPTRTTTHRYSLPDLVILQRNCPKHPTQSPKSPHPYPMTANRNQRDTRPSTPKRAGHSTN
jgi:hypothetical protein